MAYKVVITESFENDLDLVTAYLSQTLQNPAAAGKLLKKAEETVRLIAEHPFMFSLFSDEELEQKRYRNAPVGNYQLFYRVDESAKTVYILRFLYAGRDIATLFRSFS